MFKKKISPLEERMKKIDSELSSVVSNIDSLSKGEEVRSSRTITPRNIRNIPPAKPSRTKLVNEERVGPKEEEYLESLRENVHDERFSDYLASSFESVGPLRHERRIQRNRAIFMVVVVVFVLFMLIYKIFLR